MLADLLRVVSHPHDQVGANEEDGVSDVLFVRRHVDYHVARIVVLAARVQTEGEPVDGGEVHRAKVVAEGRVRDVGIHFQESRLGRKV